MPDSKRASYGQFCPVAMASELVCKRWTTLILRELLCGSTRYNQLQKGLPRISPALLSTRLRELESHGLLDRTEVEGNVEYHLTEAGAGLRPVILGLGDWGHRWIETSASLANLDPSLLMWDMRRNLNPDPLPERRCVIQFLYRNLPRSKQCWWLLVEGDGDVGLCYTDPGFDVDLKIITDLRTMTGIWMGYTLLDQEVIAGNLCMTGDKAISKSINQWLSLSPFAKS